MSVYELCRKFTVEPCTVGLKCIETYRKQVTKYPSTSNLSTKFLEARSYLELVRAFDAVWDSTSKDVCDIVEHYEILLHRIFQHHDAYSVLSKKLDNTTDISHLIQSLCSGVEQLSPNEVVSICQKSLQCYQ